MAFKRQISTDSEIKRSRSKFDSDDILPIRDVWIVSKILSFEDLANEIYYEIFDYLDACQIHRAFLQLNTRFQQLIHSPVFPLKVIMNDKVTKNRFKRIINDEKDRICSLHLWNSLFVKRFFKNWSFDCSFTRLQSIVLYDLRGSRFIDILSSLKCLPSLFELNIHLNHASTINLNKIYSMILRLPFLKWNSLTLDREDEPKQLIILDNIKRTSKIESLSINHHCTLKELTHILRYTPHLRLLNCQNLTESDDTSIVNLPDLTHITIGFCDVAFPKFRAFFQNINAVHLRMFQCEEFKTSSYTEPHQWEELIATSMPQLHRLIINCAVDMDENFHHVHFDTFVEQINSQFWSQRQYIVRLEIKRRNCAYVICPNRYNQKEDLFQMVRDEQINDPIKELYIAENLLDVRWYSSFLEKLTFVLQGIQFRILNITCHEISIPILIKILRLLPNLDSLRMEVLSWPQFSSLTEEDAADLLLISNNNRITKVWQSVQHELTHFLLRLCPHMQHFEIIYVDNEDLQTLVSDILMKTRTNIPRLHSLQLNIRNGNDQIMNNLQMMIDSKGLLSNYTIKRRCNDLFLQWK